MMLIFSFIGWKFYVCKEGIYLRKIDLLVPWEDVDAVSHVWINEWSRRPYGRQYFYNRKSLVIYRNNYKPICIYTRGPGEKKLESDRRHIRNRMDDIKRELKTAETARKTQKSRQIKNQIPLVALVGYTNAGKSATMNCILDSPGREEKKVKSQDMLFATLDTSERKIDMGCNKKFILVDTVGFVSNLPHSLIEAFKSTLEEAVYADLILNIVDVSSEEREFQEEVTKKVLEEMGASGKILTLYNKSDLLDNPQNIVEINKKDSFLISAKTGEGMKKVLEYIEDALFSDVVNLKMIIPYNRGELIAFIYDKSRVLSEEHRAEGTFIECVTEEKYVNKLKEFVL